KSPGISGKDVEESCRISSKERSAYPQRLRIVIIRNGAIRNGIGSCGVRRPNCLGDTPGKPARESPYQLRYALDGNAVILNCLTIADAAIIKLIVGCQICRHHYVDPITWISQAKADICRS